MVVQIRNNLNEVNNYQLYSNVTKFDFFNEAIMSEKNLAAFEYEKSLNSKSSIVRDLNFLSFYNW